MVRPFAVGYQTWDNIYKIPPHEHFLKINASGLIVRERFAIGYFKYFSLVLNY